MPRRPSRLRTEIVCRHHNAVLVFDCENAGSGNNGLPTHRWVQSKDELDVGFDGLGVLDSLSKGVLDVGRPLVNRMGSVGIKGIVPLWMLQSAPES